MKKIFKDEIVGHIKTQFSNDENFDIFFQEEENLNKCLLSFFINTIVFDCNLTFDELINKTYDNYLICEPNFDEKEEYDKIFSLCFFDKDKKNDKYFIDLIEKHIWTYINENIDILFESDDKIKVYILTNHKYSSDFKKNVNDFSKKNFNLNVEIFYVDDLCDIFRNKYSSKLYVDKYIFNLDDGNNVLHSPINCEKPSVVVNISANSIKAAYTSYGRNYGPLYSLNLRYYVSNKTIDKELKESIEKGYKDFWYLNNGIVIICEDFEINKEKNYIILKNFSFVNGGQTTHMIGNTEKVSDFFVTAKIIKIKGDNSEEMYQFAEKISIATNKQKAIKDKDLISNSKDVNILSKELLDADNPIYLISKRGKKKNKKVESIELDLFFQLVCSFYLQNPGKIKSGKSYLWKDPLKSEIFENKNSNSTYAIKHIFEWLEKISKVEVKKTNISSEMKKIYNTGKLFIFSAINFIWMYLQKTKEIDQIVSNYNNNPDEKELLNSLKELNYKKITKIKEEESGFKGNFESLIYEITQSISYVWDKQKDEHGAEFSNFTKRNSNYIKIILLINQWLSFNERKKNEISQIITQLFE